MRATIIGWYGTETIGDRAILAGIIECIKGQVDEIYLGSIHPFFSERTIKEDMKYYKEYVGYEGIIELFDSKDIKTTEKMILNSQLLIMGGGPLMHIRPLDMVEYCFKYARKNNIKTIILGCGVGPIFKKGYPKKLYRIFKNSDKIILRDTKAYTYAKECFMNINKNIEEFEIKIAYDPAVLACLTFKTKSQKNYKKKYDLLINLRDFPKEYAKSEQNIKNARNMLKGIIRLINNRNGKKMLLPNHYFFIGGDDRDYFFRLKFSDNINDIEIHNKPINLIETFEIIQSAKYCIGCRFHSILFQTILNGNNYAIDYTEPNKGKIYGFLKDINFSFQNYINIQASKEVPLSIIKPIKNKPIINPARINILKECLK